METMRRAVGVLIGVVGLSVIGVAQGADAVRGKALFSNTNGAPLSCAASACHSGFPSVQRNGIGKGSNATVILNAISSDKGGMRILMPYVNTTDASDIAAYIANPAAGNGAPAIALTATSLTFASQTLGTTNAAGKSASSTIRRAAARSMSSPTMAGSEPPGMTPHAASSGTNISGTPRPKTRMR